MSRYRPSPIISAGEGSVISVNGKQGEVVLKANDIPFNDIDVETALTNLFEGKQFYDNFSQFPSVGKTDVLYVDKENNSIYVWDDKSSKYVQISSSGKGIEEWQPNTNYIKKDIVLYDGRLYQCLINHTSTDFESDSNYWLIIGESKYIHISSDDPLETDTTDKGFFIGQLWLNQSDKRVWIFVNEYVVTDDNGNEIREAEWINLTGESNGIEHWKPETAYKEGKLIVYNFRIYQALMSHISSRNFNEDSDKWQVVGSGGGTYLASEILVDPIPSAGIHNNTSAQDALEIIGRNAEQNKQNLINLNENLNNTKTKVDSNTNKINDHEQRIQQIETGELDRFVKSHENDPQSGYLIDKIDNNTIILDLTTNKILAAKLDGQLVTIDEINTLSGIKENVQKQIDALSIGMQWQGEVSNYNELLNINDPQNGWTFIVKQDETKDNARTAYIYNEQLQNWIFFGDLSFIQDATTSTKGIIKISGDLTGVADNIQLKDTGVVAGAYTNPSIVVDSKGRIVSATNGSLPVSNNSIEYYIYFPPEQRINKRLFIIPEYTMGSNTLEVFVEGVRQFPNVDYIEKSPTEIEFFNDVSDEHGVAIINAKWDKGFVGTKQVDESDIGDGKILTYDSNTNKLVYSTPPSTSFIGLTDTPDNYVGKAGKILAVNHLEDGIEFIDPPTSSGGGVIVNGTIISGLYELVPSNNIQLIVNQDDKKITIRHTLNKWSPNKNYRVGETVWLETPFGNEMYVCKENHMSTFDFNEDIEKWELISGGRGGVATFKEIKTIVNVSPNSNNMVSLDTHFDKFELRTVYAKSTEERDIKVSIFDHHTNGDLVYESLIRSRLYDIVNVPMEDKSGGKKVHILVENHSDIATTVELKIKITNLL